MKSQLIVLILLMTNVFVFAQPFQISGRVLDDDTQEGVPFCNVFIQGESIGTVTDIDGNYQIKLQQKFESLSVSAIGYTTQKKPISDESVQQINFRMASSSLILEEIVVIAGENPANEIVRNIIKNKDNNRLDKFEYYAAEDYTKVELDFHNLEENLLDNRWLKDFQFLYDFVDSVSDDKPFLPIFIKETMSDVYGKNGNTKSEVKAAKQSGIGNASVLRFMDKMHLPYNAYDNRINVLEKGLVSPFASSGLFYYEYYIEDSTEIDGKWCHKLRFKPKRKQENTFQGDFWVADSSFAIVRLNMRMSEDVNINFIDRVIIYENYNLIDDQWVISKKKMVLDFTATKEAPGLIGRKTASYRKYKFDDPELENAYDDADVNAFDIDELGKDPNYWATARHDSLSKNELQIYGMLDTIKSLPAYERYTTIIIALATGYIPIIKNKGIFTSVGLGPYFNTYYTNIVEGNHFQLGTQIDMLDKSMRLEATVGYGTKDKDFKYFFRYRWRLKENPRLMLGASYLDDIVLSNRSSEELTSAGLLNNTFRRDLPMRLLRAKEGKIWVDKFWKKGFQTRATILHREIDPYGGVEANGAGFNYQFKNSNTNQIDTTVNTTEASLKLRYSYKDKRINGRFNYVELGSSKYPVVGLTYTAGIQNVLGSDYNYHKLNLEYSHWVYTNPFGWFLYQFQFGKVFSKNALPMLLLEMHPGNDTYYYNPATFNVMNRFEFVSDEYVSMHLEHHFDGYFLNKIPLMKKLDWRSLVTFSGVIGSLSEENFQANSLNTSDSGGTLTTPIPIRSPSNIPYMEVGVGIENIFKFFQVHTIWRLNYLDNPEAQRFMIQGRFAFSF